MAEQTDNEIKTVIEGWIGDMLSQVHTCIPGKIISYNPAENRAVVQPTGAFKTEDGRSLPYPVIYSVPCVFPVGGGGKTGLTFPIAAGDGCLIVFAESHSSC